jgi:hypothetical protein
MTRAVRAGLLAGTVTGIAGTLLFGTMHAMLIVPIWTRLLSGMPLAIATGLAAGWALTELTAGQRAALRGGSLAVACWLAILPVQFVDLGLRQVPWVATHDWITVVAAIVMSVACGSLMGWVIARRRRAVIASAVLLFALTLTMGGPLPLDRSDRAPSLLIGFLPLFAIAGIVLGALMGALDRAPRAPA